ncbi:hypothetical protein [Emticicia fontis]
MDIKQLKKLKKKGAKDIPYHVTKISEVKNSSVKVMNLAFFESMNGSMLLYTNYYKPISRILSADNEPCIEEIIS